MFFLIHHLRRVHFLWYKYVLEMSAVAIEQLDRQDIARVHAFSVSVFNTIATPNAHPSLADYEQRFDNRKGIILGAVCDSQLVGYLFAHSSQASEQVASDPKEGIHIWLCATDSMHRRKGIATKLFDAIHDISMDRHVQYLSINTYPEYFPDMYKLLSSDSSYFTCTECCKDSFDNYKCKFKREFSH